MSHRLRSRKFWVAVGTAIGLVLVDGLGFELDKETIIAVVTIVAGYLLGQSFVDAKSKTIPPVPTPPDIPGIPPIPQP